MIRRKHVTMIIICRHFPQNRYLNLTHTMLFKNIILRNTNYLTLRFTTPVLEKSDFAESNSSYTGIRQFIPESMRTAVTMWTSVHWIHSWHCSNSHEIKIKAKSWSTLRPEAPQALFLLLNFVTPLSLRELEQHKTKLSNSAALRCLLSYLLSFQWIIT